MDVEPNFTYIGGYGRKTFIQLAQIDKIKGIKEVWAYVAPHSKISENQLARLCYRVLKQVNLIEIIEKLVFFVKLKETASMIYTCTVLIQYCTTNVHCFRSNYLCKNQNSQIIFNKSLEGPRCILTD